ncbi:unnamed protein product [Didymodactylos carnosus]|uniref:Mitochondrial inner membrane protein Mpv17 n=1 Tax=Didymodactylos carnosus TaxID=1234261 RepID=A0A813WUK2_9BILA|nr:unnamed protein product [Didymodactylos carnosus]CAF3643530.1 unnamed protein product [Didymodactylos carnosus]
MRLWPAASAKLTEKGWRTLIKPYIFTTLAIGTSVTAGDLMCQYLERHKTTAQKDKGSDNASGLEWWNSQRTLIMCTSAVLVSTPYSFTLARTVERLFPGKQGIQIAKKMLTNTLMGPVGISLAFTSIGLLKGQSFEEIKLKIVHHMPQTFLLGNCYWPFVSFINFRYIPLNYRPFLGTFAGMFWNIYVSTIANKDNDVEDDKKEENTKIGKHEQLSVPLQMSGTGAMTVAIQHAWNMLDKSGKDENKYRKE